MSLMLVATLVMLGGIGGFAAGFLGIGRGVLLFPLLLYIPPLVGVERLDVKSVAALAITQVFCATLVGGAAHWRHGRVHGQLVCVAAVAAMAGSFLGGMASRWVSEELLLLLFGVVTLLAAAMMFLPAPPAVQEDTPQEKIVIHPLPLAVLAGLTGTVVGFLGAGNFLFVPLLIYVFKVPIRMAIGSNLIIAVLSTFSGFVGKLLTGQVPFLMALAVVLGAGLGALGGERSHDQISPRLLRYIYAGVVGLIAIRIWLTLLD